SNIVSSVNNARLNNNLNNHLHPKLAASPSYFGAQSLPGGDSCDFECLPATNYDNNANFGGQANRTQIAGVERVLFSLDQMSVLTDCVAGVQHQQQLLDQALNDREP
uniref:Pepsin-I3 domain-containing protein n=1 Tax=Globodera pallida TaxID=36090 RepID=A0A183CTB1_GLOPA